MAKRQIGYSIARPYWRSTRIQMLLCLLVPLVALPLLPLIISTYNIQSFLGFPLGYFLAGHGFVLAGIFTIGWYVRRQDAIDHWHGANEDL
jgi:putative solute:sodium symporter small subunit